MPPSVRRKLAVLAWVLPISGCYLAHERAIDAARPDVGTDVGMDAGPTCGPPLGTLVALTVPHPFRMEATEVTREAYARFVACNGTPMCAHGSPCTPEAGDPQTPMVCVTPCEARAYCAWAGRRLCTEDEWSATCAPILASVLGDGEGVDPHTCVLAAYSDGVWSYMPSHDALQDVGAASGCHGADAPYDRLLDVVGNAAEIVSDATSAPIPMGSNVASGFHPSCLALEPMSHVDEAQGLVGFRCCAD